MTLTIPIPEDLEKTLRSNVDGDLAVYVREVIAVDLYRSRKLTHGQVQKFLGVSSYEADAILKKHGGVDDLTPAELGAQVDASRTSGQTVTGMIVVSDNSPLQYLVLVGCVDVLPALYGQVMTTPQVLDELQRSKTPDMVRNWASSPPPWLSVQAPIHVDFLDTLDIGEASAISLARERHADLLLIDERAGNDTARQAGIQAIGTLGVLIEAGLEDLVEFEAVLKRLTDETPFYASPRLIETARKIFQDRRK